MKEKLNLLKLAESEMRAIRGGKEQGGKCLGGAWVACNDIPGDELVFSRLNVATAARRKELAEQASTAHKRW